MGPVDWRAVMLAAVLSIAVRLAFDAVAGARKAGRASSGARRLAAPVVAFFLASVMLGHNFARIGSGTLHAKPWLYFMQTGGVALFFVIPAVWLSQARPQRSVRAGIVDCGAWLVAYLAMGLVFWALG